MCGGINCINKLVPGWPYAGLEVVHSKNHTRAYLSLRQAFINDSFGNCFCMWKNDCSSMTFYSTKSTEQCTCNNYSSPSSTRVIMSISSHIIDDDVCAYALITTGSTAYTITGTNDFSFNQAANTTYVYRAYKVPGSTNNWSISCKDMNHTTLTKPTFSLIGQINNSSSLCMILDAYQIVHVHWGYSTSWGNCKD